MSNPYAGEVALILNGKPHAMKLTLGALVEVEEALADRSLVSLVQRFEEGGFSTRDVMVLILAGLRGGGWTGQADELTQGQIDGGPMAAVKAAALLLARAFAMPEVRPDASND